MLSLDDLKRGLHEPRSRSDKALLSLAYLGRPASVAEIKDAMLAAGFREHRKWNVSEVLRSVSGLAINVSRKWELTERGIERIRDLGFLADEPAKLQLATDLRVELNSIADPERRRYLEEAINCYEAGYYRAAVVMSWVAAFHVLKSHVFHNYLQYFNQEMSRVNGNWKHAKSMDDLGLMKEREFLDRIAYISIIGKNVKTELIKCLDLRNACGHPNSLQISGNAVAYHLEILLLNVFRVF